MYAKRLRVGEWYGHSVLLDPDVVSQ
jgi:hypothetical protein